MAITRTVFEDYFDSSLIDADRWIVWAAAQAGSVPAVRQVMGEPQFVVEATATTDTSDLEAIDLTDEGLLFPADSVRTLRGKSYISTDNDHFAYEWEESVLGGTTPVLLGQRIITGFADMNSGTVFEYGHCHFQATITALTTITTISSSKGYSAALGDVVNADSDFLVPPLSKIMFKTARLDSAVIQTGATGTLVTIDYTNLDGLGAGTDAIKFFTQTAASTVTGVNPVVGAKIDLAWEIWPPINHRLVMNSNNVELKLTATNSNVGVDILRHRCELFIGPLTRLVHKS